MKRTHDEIFSHIRVIFIAKAFQMVKTPAASHVALVNGLRSDKKLH